MNTLQAEPMSASTSAVAFTHKTALTQFVETNGIRFAYRRYGKTGGLPLVFIQHLSGNLENWDSKITDGLALDREVILFDNAGIGASTGATPDTFDQAAKDVVSFIQALGFKKIDLLGFSIGGMQAQNICISHPDLVRRLILVGTTPRNGEGPWPLNPEAIATFTAKYDDPDGIWLAGMFPRSEQGLAAGHAFLGRFNARQIDRDPVASDKVTAAQIASMGEWGNAKGERFSELKQIKQKTLVIHGNHDEILRPINGYYLAENLPDAELIMLPDAAHSPQSRHPEHFLRHVNHFLLS